MDLQQQIKWAAATLGLTERSSGAEGVIEGHAIALLYRPLDREVQLRIDGALTPPLDLGLHMRRREVILGALGQIPTGSEDLDLEFSRSADDVERARELFTPDLRAHLVALHRAAYDVRLYDEGCAIAERNGVDVDAPWIVQATHKVVETLKVLDEARVSVPAAAPLRGHAEALASLAATHGLAFRTAPLGVWGEIEGRTIAVGSARKGNGKHHLTVRAPFETELGLRLALRRENLFDGVRSWLGGQDVKVGDAVFDRRFLVRADPTLTSRVPGLFDAHVREVLRALDAQLGPVSIDDRALTIAPVLSSVAPDALLAALVSLDEARVRIERNRLHGSAGGPYR
ncbi:hypothetical protein [Chondromyces apiculatus]|uniref:Uncharacterized protein n=1 Tax=Chondromyces apiculatus DSM 436 TaxID=1192034 RepID=A0A017SWA3_9BACT|nr:hypothetical protein [Chondromyces apiculatus]EYF00556.1 Hypothetical protein CAP_0485 [Chondromyces apiculatus DSM 436]